MCVDGWIGSSTLLFHSKPSPTQWPHTTNTYNTLFRSVDALLEQDIPRLIAEVEDTYAALHHGHAPAGGSAGGKR